MHDGAESRTGSKYSKVEFVTFCVPPFIAKPGEARHAARTQVSLKQPLTSFTLTYHNGRRRPNATSLTEIISDAKKSLLDTVTKHFFSYGKIFFSWHKNFLLAVRKINSCCKKKSCGKEKNISFIR